MSLEARRICIIPHSPITSVKNKENAISAGTKNLQVGSSHQHKHKS